jgi:ABC-type nitrate/sulfonate/bicarbonate transport system permease component
MIGRLAGRLLRRVTAPSVLLPVAALIVFVIAWEVIGQRMHPLLFAPPTRVAETFVELLRTGELLGATAVTLYSLGVSFGLAVVSGIPFGVLLARKPLLSRVVEPYIDAIYATPRVVLVPLVIIWIGIGIPGIIFIAWLGAVIPIIINTAVGVRHARPDLIEVGKSLLLTERQLTRHILLPGALPYVIAGLAIGAGRALIGVIIGEIFLDLRGLGGHIQISAAFFDVPSALSGIVVVAAMGTALLGSLQLLERRLSAWKT